nr:hypothetical protein CFP56_32340 [Quercus suber]
MAVVCPAMCLSHDFPGTERVLRSGRPIWEDEGTRGELPCLPDHWRNRFLPTKMRRAPERDQHGSGTGKDEGHSRSWDGSWPGVPVHCPMPMASRHLDWRPRWSLVMHPVSLTKSGTMSGTMSGTEMPMVRSAASQPQWRQCADGLADARPAASQTVPYMRSVRLRPGGSGGPPLEGERCERLLAWERRVQIGVGWSMIISEDESMEDERNGPITLSFRRDTYPIRLFRVNGGAP